ncbi:MAG: hypothetical protein J2P31_19745, partial [Blastocatellia bacterium]|nr:hypothetical protein [Blastocatellia bacterium]
MLWKKGWWETRWLFLTGLAAILLMLALMFAIDYDAAKWLAKLRHSEGLSEGERNILASFQGRTWALWFKALLNFLWTDYAVIMGAACLMNPGFACLMNPCLPAQGGAGLFTLSLPVSRRKVLWWQALIGFSEIFLVALIVPILLPLIARFQGQWFSWKDALIYTLMMVLGGAVFFCFSFLLAVILGNFIVAFIVAEAVVIAHFLSSQS